MTSQFILAVSDDVPTHKYEKTCWRLRLKVSQTRKQQFTSRAEDRMNH